MNPGRSLGGDQGGVPGLVRPPARYRTEVAPQLGLRIATRIGEPVTLVMTRRMLHGIKQRAEHRTRQGGS